LTLQRRNLHAEAQQAIVSEGLAQGSYVAPRTGFKLVELHSFLSAWGLDLALEEEGEEDEDEQR